MMLHTQLSNSQLYKAIRDDKIAMAGNVQLKIYGRLNCSSGKRMTKQNRVFFVSKEEAKAVGYRPCGHCMPEEYNKWKNGVV